MKNKIINYCLNNIKKQYPNYNDEKIAEIKYGLEGIYLLITKLVVITALALLLGLGKEFLIFLVFYNSIRMPSFGIHATKSWVCLIVSTIVFIGIPWLATILVLNRLEVLLIGMVLIVMIAVWSPADTVKRPIINAKRRLIYKIISTLIACVYVIVSLLIKNQFIINCLLLALLYQSVMICPFTYKIFKLPYNNYKRYLAIS